MAVDVCLVIEGSYPYVTGGVASWVHQLVCGLPEVRFGLTVLVPDRAFAEVDRYPVPPNVVERQLVTLFDELPRSRTLEAGEAARRELQAFHAMDGAARCPRFGAVADALAKDRQTAFSLQTAESSWELLAGLYEARGREVAFLDYFWTWRATHGPVLRLLDAPLIEAPVYHALSTGYAGCVAALAKHRHGVRTLLTEHGIYTRERDIEIAQAAWIFQEPVEGSAYAPDESFFKTWWHAQYDFMGKLVYGAADRIVTLNDVNRRYQITAGAPAEKMVHVPNGIDLPSFVPLRATRDWSERPFRVGLVGRVVPIKDIKTFLRAVLSALNHIALEAYVIGPMDEDADYTEECLELTRMLELESEVTFVGRADVLEWLPRLDLNVLTSISESQPLVLLEGWAAGIPAVATDVGACREMVDGRAGEDALLGPAGLVTPVATPEATGAAIVAIARDPARHAAMAAAGIARVERFYRQEAVFEAYRGLYRDLKEAP